MFSKLLLRGLAIAAVASGGLLADDDSSSTRVPYNVVGSGVITTQGISSSKLNNSTATTSTGMFYIGQSGYYYLSDDLQPLGNSVLAAAVPIILIDADDVVLDLATKGVLAPAATADLAKVTAGIQIADGRKNVVIKNGSVKGINNSATLTPPATTLSGFGIFINSTALNPGTVTNIVIDNVTVSGCGYFGIFANQISNLTLTGVQCISNGPTVDANASTSTTGALFTNATNFVGGAYLRQVTSANIDGSCSFSSNGTQAANTQIINAVGLYLDNCSNIELSNNIANGNTNITSEATTANLTAGVYLLDSTSCEFTNVAASNNSRINGGAAAVQAACYGFYVHGASTSPYGSANSFIKCMASNNQGVRFAAGFAVDGASSTDLSGSNQFIDCVAELNRATTTTITFPASAFGFYNKFTASNTFLRCRGNNNITPGAGAGTITRIAAGFYSAGGFTNQFIDCQGNRNNISSAQTGGTAIAAGIILGDPSTSTVVVETSSIVRKADLNRNATLGTGATDVGQAFGVAIYPHLGTTGNVSTGNVVENCNVSYNISSSTSTSLGNSFGIIDWTIGATASFGGPGVGTTTLLRANISTGQGGVFAGGTTVNNPLTTDMNYFVDFATVQMKITNSVKETNLANLNNIADINGLNLFNWSFTTS